jgi:hypothetical protein
MAGRPPRFPAGAGSPGVATILALHGQPVDDIPGLPPGMLAILRQCLAADPVQRLPSAAALRDGLAALLEQPALFQVFDSPSTVLRNRSTTPAPPPLAASLIRSAQYAGIPGPGDAVTSPPAGPGAEATAVPDLRRHPTLARARARPLVLATLGGSGLVLVIVAALLVIPRLAGPGNPGPVGNGAAGNGAAGAGAAAVIGAFGIATTTSHCPAASVPGAGARCPASPECWNGVNEYEGVITVRALPCDKPHTWQTFAIGIMPTDASTIDVNVVQANPAVHAVCSSQVLLRSRAGKARQIPAAQWQIQVVPPDEEGYNTGVRTYRCFASIGLDGAQTSQFGA